MNDYRIDLLDEQGRAVAFLEIEACSGRDAIRQGRRYFGAAPAFRLQVRPLSSLPVLTANARLKAPVAQAA